MMAKKQNPKREKNKTRDVLTGKIINGKEVIEVRNIKEYLKKLGYSVIPTSLKNNIIIFATIFLVFGALILLSSIVSAQTPFDSDLTNEGGRLGLIMFGILCVLLFYYNQYVLSSIFTVILGFIMANSGINIIISFCVIALGIWIAFREEG